MRTVRARPFHMMMTLVVIAGAIAASPACGRKNVKVPGALAVAAAPRSSSPVDAGRPTKESDRVDDRTAGGTGRRTEATPSGAVSSTGVVEPHGPTDSGAVGTSSVVITQTPGAHAAQGTLAAPIETTPDRDRERGNARRIAIASLVALGLIAVIRWVPKLTDA